MVNTQNIIIHRQNTIPSAHKQTENIYYIIYGHLSIIKLINKIIWKEVLNLKIIRDTARVKKKHNKNGAGCGCGCKNGAGCNCGTTSFVSKKKPHRNGTGCGCGC